jgi:hypothetical protein
MTETVTPKDAQKARITYLLRIAGTNAGLSGWTAQVISQLAPEFQKAMETEGMVLMFQSAFDAKVREMEAEIQ